MLPGGVSLSAAAVVGIAVAVACSRRSYGRTRLLLSSAAVRPHFACDINVTDMPTEISDLSSRSLSLLPLARQSRIERIGYNTNILILAFLAPILAFLAFLAPILAF